MSIIEKNKCNDCAYGEKCEFKLDRGECITKMSCRLSNIGYMTDFFEFSFECKEFKNK